MELFSGHMGLETIRGSVVVKDATFKPGQNKLKDDIFAKVRRVSRRY
ncbi:MAG: hypothetical protein ACUZ8H_07865 [Candidatus Anammoxibacter sp.]